MHHDMMGPGGYGGRDCPWGGYRGGYGMGPDMMGPGSGYGMGPGMMGPGGDRGMGPGMMNRDDSRQYHGDQVAPAEKNTGASKEN